MFDNVKNNINWLAQCKKRRGYPIDQSDRAGLNAFEYGWKSFNNLYNEFDTKPDRKKMILCIEKYIDEDQFFNAYHKDLTKFCDIEHRVYLADKQYESLNPEMSKKVISLKKAIDIQDCASVLTELVACLYFVRNARIHGSFGTGKTIFSFLPKAIYLLNISILSSKLKVSCNQLEFEIDKRISEIKTGR